MSEDTKDATAGGRVPIHELKHRIGRFMHDHDLESVKLRKGMLEITWVHGAERTRRQKLAAERAALHDAVARGMLEDEHPEPIAGKVVEFAMGGHPGETMAIGCTADECALMVVVPGAAVTGKMMGSILNAEVSITLAEVSS